MSSIYDVKSTLTQTTLDAFCQKYHILNIVHPELPGPNKNIRNSPTGKIGVYTRFFYFANFRIPLSRFLVDVLEYFCINLWELSVITAAKISHFEILCRIHGYVLTVALFRRFYVNSKNKGWLSFSKRSENAPVCHTKPLDSLKNWNNSFFCVDASVFSSSVPWHTKKTLVRDPSPTAAEFSAEAYDFLATHPAPFRKFLEPFLCLVGLSCYYDLDDNVYPTFLTSTGEEMDLFAFIHHAAVLYLLVVHVDLMRKVGDADQRDRSRANVNAGKMKQLCILWMKRFRLLLLISLRTLLIILVDNACRYKRSLPCQVFHYALGDDCGLLLTADYARGALSAPVLGVRPRQRSRDGNKIERKCARQVDMLKEKDVEIANLKAQLSLKEAEATEAIRLRSQVLSHPQNRTNSGKVTLG
ncbi:hypothetical protein Tco_0794526 [Tanacetum coccineum]